MPAFVFLVMIGAVAESLTEKQCFPYKEVPHFPVSTVKGHEGQLVFGLLQGVPVMCMQGRFHYFEGYPICKVRFGVIGLVHLMMLLLSFILSQWMEGSYSCSII
jgi:purine-nucleoside phosphorylase